MDETPQMNWKAFIVRLIEALRWPAAFVAACLIFREPLTRILNALVHSGH